MPKPLHPLVIDRPALPQQQAVGHASALTNVVCSDLPELFLQLGLLNQDDVAGMALATAVLAHDTAGQTLRYPEPIVQGHDGPTAACRARLKTLFTLGRFLGGPRQTDHLASPSPPSYRRSSAAICPPEKPLENPSFSVFSCQDPLGCKG